MEHRTHILSFKREKLPLLQGQTVLEEMTVRTCRISFESRYWTHRLITVQCFCHCPAYTVVPADIPVHKSTVKQCIKPVPACHIKRIYIKQLNKAVIRLIRDTRNNIPYLRCQTFFSAIPVIHSVLCPFIGNLDPEARKHMHYCFNKIWRIDRFPITVKLWIWNIQSPPWLCNQHIKIQSLCISLHPGCRSELYLFTVICTGSPLLSCASCGHRIPGSIHKEFPLHIRDDTAVSAVHRYYSIIYSHEKQGLDITQSCSCYITDLHIIIRGRDHTCPYLCKTGIQKLCKFFNGNNLSREQSHHFIKQIT